VARRANIFDVEAAAGQEPGTDRVGVPYLAGVEFVAFPYRRGDGDNELEQSSGDRRVGRYTQGLSIAEARSGIAPLRHPWIS
jgi:hypothetical protein